MPPRPSSPRPIDNRPTFVTKDGSLGVVDHKGRNLVRWSIRHGHFLDRPIVSIFLRRRDAGRIMVVQVRADIGRRLDIMTASAEGSLDRARIWRTAWRDPWTGAESVALALGSAHDPCPPGAYVFTAQNPGAARIGSRREERYYLRTPTRLWSIPDQLVGELAGRRLEIPDGAWRLDVVGEERRRLVFKVPDELAAYVAAAPLMVRVRYELGPGEDRRTAWITRLKGRWMPYDQIPSDPLGVDFGGSARTYHLYRKARLTRLAKKVAARLEQRKQQEQAKGNDDGLPADGT